MLSRQRQRLLVVAGFAFVYLYAFPYFDQLRSANELPRVLTTQEIVEHGTFRLDARLHTGELGSTFDIATTPDGRHYSNKAPGVSLLAVPIYLGCKLVGATSLRACTWAFRITVVTLPALLFLPFFFGLTRRFAPPERHGEHPRRAALVAYALGSLALPYGLLFMSHQNAAVAAGAAFLAAVALVRGEARRPALAALLAGLFAGLAVLMDYQAALAAAAVGIYVLVRSPRRWRDTALVGAGAVPPALALAAYHQACFGSPLRTGYSYAADPANHQGVMGIIGPNGAALWNAVLAPSNGLLVLMPWVLLAVVGGVAIARDAEARARVGAEAIVCGAVVVAYVLFVGSLVPEFGRAGWSVGPRYITVAMPFAAWLAAAGLAAADRHAVARAAAHGLILAAVGVYVVATVTWPHWPEYLANPLHELSLRLLGSGRAVHSLGTGIGLRGVLSVLPLFAAVVALAALLLGVRPRGRLITTVAAFALAAALLWSYRAFPRTGPRAERAWRFVTSVWEPR